MSQIRILEPGDQAALEAALTLRAEDSLHMLWNLRQVGLKPGTAPYHGEPARSRSDAVLPPDTTVCPRQAISVTVIGKWVFPEPRSPLGQK